MLNSYQFPKTKFVDETSIPTQLLHIASEMWEIIKALLIGDREHAIHECFDLIGSVETLIHKLIKRSWGEGIMLNSASIRLDVYNKNLLRGYYKTK